MWNQFPFKPSKHTVTVEEPPKPTVTVEMKVKFPTTLQPKTITGFLLYNLQGKVSAENINTALRGKYFHKCSSVHGTVKTRTEKTNEEDNPERKEKVSSGHGSTGQYLLYHYYCELASVW